jgi:hypothetical protein
LRTAAGLVAAVSVAGLSGLALLQAPFEPGERWKEVAATIERTFPPGTAIFPSSGSLDAPESRWNAFLGVYFHRREDFPEADSFDAGAFAAGRLIIHERPYRSDRRLSAASFPAGTVRLVIPQEHLGFQAIWTCAPRDSFVEAFVAASGEGRSSLPLGGLALAPCAPLTIRLREGRRYRSLVLAFDQAAAFPPDRIMVKRENGHVGIARVAFDRDGITIVSLGDSGVTAVSLEMGSLDLAVRLVAAWAYPLP